MALNRYKLGDLIEIIDERNSFGIIDFKGLNINKEFIETVANTNGLNETKYKVVRKERFVFSGMQTGRDQCIRLSMYTKDNPVIVSPAYTTFEILRKDIVLPMYFFMIFLSKEKDRLGAFYSDGSIRTNLDWERFCEIELCIPDLPTQEKYVNIYLNMLANQKAYEQGLDDLKLVCDGYIEKLRKKYPLIELRNFISNYSEKNKDKSIVDVVGLSTTKEFRVAQSRVNRDELGGYKIVHPLDIAYVPTTDTWKVLAFAVNHFEKDVVVSPIYEVFTINREKLNPDYLAMCLKRSEFDRYARYNSWGSARENFTFDEMKMVKIPLPDINVQNSIVNIYNCYIKRKEINEKLKEQIKNICPILIKGAIEEAKEA